MFRGPYKATHVGWSNGNPQYRIGSTTLTLRVDQAHKASTDGLTAHPVEYTTDTRTSDELGARVDGAELKIDVGSLVDVAARLMEPADLAAHFWENEDVREAFCECLVNTYAGTMSYSSAGTYGEFDKNRAYILTRMNQILLERRLDRMVEVLATAEYYQARYKAIVDAYRWPLHHESQPVRPDFLPPFHLASIVELQDTFPAQEGEGAEAYLHRLRNRATLLDKEDPDYRLATGSPEARDWWRAKLIELWGLAPVLEEPPKQSGIYADPFPEDGV